MTDDVHQMTGAYALNCLSPADRELFEQHLTTCERCHTEVSGFAATMAELGAADAAPPPSDLRERVLSQVARTPQIPPSALRQTDSEPHGEPDREAAAADVGPRLPLFVPPAMRRYQRRVPEAPPQRRNWRTAAVGIGAAAVAAVAFTLGTWTAQRTQQSLVVAPSDEVTHVVAAPDAKMRPLTMTDGADVKVIAAPSMGQAVIMADRFPAAPKGMVYQVWVMGSAGSKHPMETFVPDASGSVEAMVHGDFRDATRLEITVEPTGGSPVEPTGRPIGVAELA